MEPRTQNRLKAVGALVATIVGSGLAVQAQSDSTSVSTDPTIKKLEQENQQLQDRLDAMDDLLKKEGIMPSGKAAADPPVAAMTDITLTGFVTSSYFYDVNNANDLHPTGYLWNTSMNQFTLNKVKITLASPAPKTDQWDAAYRVSLMMGQDAAVDNSSNGGGGNVGYDTIREAYVELNIPIGTGLDFRAGELISLLNYESGDGGAVNANFSQGYQWWYTGNGPEEGIQLAYNFNDMVGVKARVVNGLYNGERGSGSKTVMGGIYVNPDKITSLTLLGFGGDQQAGIPNWYLSGASFIGSRQLIPDYNVTFATELDYFHFSGFDNGGTPFAGGASNGEFWSAGGWLTADLTKQVTVALRTEYLDDYTGFGTIYNSPNPANVEVGAPNQPISIYTTGMGQRLFDATLTLDYSPVPQFKLQPEIRWNDTSVHNGFGARRNQIILGMGASYLF
jgi:hypothetical protein